MNTVFSDLLILSQAFMENFEDMDSSLRITLSPERPRISVSFQLDPSSEGNPTALANRRKWQVEDTLARAQGLLYSHIWELTHQTVSGDEFFGRITFHIHPGVKAPTNVRTVDPKEELRVFQRSLHEQDKRLQVQVTFNGGFFTVHGTWDAPPTPEQKSGVRVQYQLLADTQGDHFTLSSLTFRDLTFFFNLKSNQ